MPDLGMPTLIELPAIHDCASLCREPGRPDISCYTLYHGLSIEINDHG